MSSWWGPFLWSLAVGIIGIVVLSFTRLRKYSALLEETRENVLFLIAPLALTLLPATWTDQYPAPPAKVKAIPVSPTEIRLVWSSGSRMYGPLHTEQYRVEMRNVWKQNTVPLTEAQEKATKWRVVGDDFEVTGADGWTCSTVVDNLEAGGETEYRVTAWNSRGETPMLQNPVRAKTKLMPNDEDGGSGPNYVWGQTKERVTVVVKLKTEEDDDHTTVDPATGEKRNPGARPPLIVTSKQIDVKLKPKELLVKVAGKERLNGQLPFFAVPDDLTWTLEAEKNALELEFAKRDPGTKWPTLLQGHPEIDVEEVVFSSRMFGGKGKFKPELMKLGLT
ncbi:unnamed protein product [Amoebophrya sp. A120]|nr:unnamed protein product [Amoebophrya sp. A120]|eukprot:GSA120T00002043001.1